VSVCAASACPATTFEVPQTSKVVAGQADAAERRDRAGTKKIWTCDGASLELASSSPARQSKHLIACSII
jgi:hypothetical protein